jgi:hypothetical protein
MNYYYFMKKKTLLLKQATAKQNILVSHSGEEK